MISRKCNQHIWNHEEDGWDLCDKPAVSWTKRVLIDCDEDPGIITYDAFCEEHLPAERDDLMSSKEIDVLDVHES